MRLPGDGDLDGPFGIGENAREAVGIVQQERGAFVLGEAPGEAERQGFRIENALRFIDAIRAGAGDRELACQPLARPEHEALAVAIAHPPQLGRRDLLHPLDDVRRNALPLLAQLGVRPQLVGGRRVPRWNVDAVGDVPDRNFLDRAARKEIREQFAAHLAVQPTHAVDAGRPANREVRHVERFGIVVRLHAAQAEDLADAYVHLGCERREVTDDVAGIEPVEGCGDRRVGGEHGARARDGQRDVERYVLFPHDPPGAFQHGKCRVPFVEVTDVRIESQLAQQPPAAEPERHLLLPPDFGIGFVELRRDTAV